MRDVISKAKHDILNTTPGIYAERARLLTESFLQHRDLPIPVLRGQLLHDVLSNMEVVIYDGEIIVGNQSVQRHSAQIFPEFSTDWLADELKRLPERTSDPFNMSEKDLSDVLEILDIWKGKGTKDLALSKIDEEGMQANKELVYTLTALSSGLGHITVDYSRILNIGTSGVLAKIADAEKDCTDPKKLEFYKGARLAMEGMNAFAARFAALAEEKCFTEKDPARVQELKEIAAVCRQVPQYPARNFREALQSFWFLHLIIHIESNGHSISPGRFDQYMYPFYRKDVDSGVLDREGAMFLLESLYIKFNEVNKIRDRVGTLAFGGYPMFQNLIVGGVDAQGNDVANELSILCLDAACELRMPQPSLSVRWHNNITKELMDKCCELTQKGVGMPAFFNDEVIIPLLIQTGCSLEEARDYCEVGCVEPQVPGKTEGLYSGGFMNLSKVLEITLNNGVNPTTGTEFSLKTGTDFETFEDFYAAYRKQLFHFVKLQVDADNHIDASHGERVPTPFVSCFVDDCISTGVDVRCGGAKYNYTSPNTVGLANAADALSVIKKKVFEEKSLTLDELRDMMANDYANAETCRLDFLNNVGKYGNDDDEADEMACRIAADYCAQTRKHDNIRGGQFEPGLQSISAHAMFVGTMGATSDGRRAADLVSDGGVSPAQGRDVKGATAVINSVAKLDTTNATNGALLNIKFHPSAVQGEKGKQTLTALVNSYFRKGGQHVQFNVVGGEVLRDAQKNPEEYRDLVVRVAGFSVLFTALDSVLQNDIIERTENQI